MPRPHVERSHPTLLQNPQQFGNRSFGQPESLQRQFGNECDQNSVRDK